MRKRVYNILLGMLCLVIRILLILPAQTAKAEETVPAPLTILDFKISSKTAKPGDNISYSFILAETGLEEFLDKYAEGYHSSDAPIYGIVIRWKSPLKPGTENRAWNKGIRQEVVHTFDWEETSAEQKKIKVSGIIPVMKGMQSGTWVMDTMELEFADESLTLVNKDTHIDNEETWDFMDFSMADFTVTETGRADYKAPTIDLKSLKLSKRYVKRNQKSTFQVKVKDATKIQKVECGWQLFDKKNRNSWDMDYEMTYNKKKKSYQCSVKLNTKYYNKAMLYCIYVEDIYGNERYYSIDYEYTPKIKQKYYNAYKRMMIRKR